MENSITLNLEDDFQSLCRDFDLKFKLTNEHENLSAYEVDTLLAYGQQWASDFLRKYREDDIESHYDGALIHEFELLCNQADLRNVNNVRKEPEEEGSVKPIN
ncbi:hypothetical protein ACR3FT_001322 [Yersinia enterocolitica]